MFPFKTQSVLYFKHLHETSTIVVNIFSAIKRATSHLSSIIIILSSFLKPCFSSFIWWTFSTACLSWKFNKTAKREDFASNDTKEIQFSLVDCGYDDDHNSVFVKMSKYLFLWNWAIDWFVDWCWSIDWVVGWLIDVLVGWSIDWLTGWLLACLLDQSIGRLIIWSVFMMPTLWA